MQLVPDDAQATTTGFLNCQRQSNLPCVIGINLQHVSFKKNKFCRVSQMDIKECKLEELAIPPREIILKEKKVSNSSFNWDNSFHIQKDEFIPQNGWELIQVIPASRWLHDRDLV
jgi:hypothetical protein